MRLTPAQKALLIEIATTKNAWGEEGLYIHRYKRYARTAWALRERGLVKVDRPDHSAMAQDGYVVTDAGRALVEKFGSDVGEGEE